MFINVSLRYFENVFHQLLVYEQFYMPFVENPRLRSKSTLCNLYHYRFIVSIYDCIHNAVITEKKLTIENTYSNPS